MDTQALTKEMMGTFPLLFKLVFQPCGCDTPLPTTQMQALLLLSLHGPMNMTQLASRLMISKQQLTKIAEALVEKELIERVGHTANRRVIFLSLTAQGHHFLQHQLDQKAASLSAFLALLSEEEQKTILEAFQILQSTLKRMNTTTEF